MEEQARLTYTVPKAPPKIVEKFYDWVAVQGVPGVDIKKAQWVEDVKLWPQFHACGKERKSKKEKSENTKKGDTNKEDTSNQAKVRKAITRYHNRIKECVANENYDDLGKIVDKMDVAVRMLNCNDFD